MEERVDSGYDWRTLQTLTFILFIYFCFAPVIWPFYAKRREMSFRPIYSCRQLTVKNRWSPQCLLWDFRKDVYGRPGIALQYSLNLPTDWILFKCRFLVWLDRGWSFSTVGSEWNTVKSSRLLSGKAQSSGFQPGEQHSVWLMNMLLCSSSSRQTHTHSLIRNIPELAEIHLMNLFNELSSTFTSNVIKTQLPSRVLNYPYSIYCY